MKILLTGSGGQLGYELKRSLAPLGEVIACDRSRLDLGDLIALRETVRRLAPAIIVNAAAYTAVDAAETDHATAFAINATAPGILAEEAQRLGALLIHYSTDYVFDGAKSTPYTEDDTPAPLSVYGASKLAGEQAITAIGCRHLILRTSWVFGAHGQNFMKTILRLARERDALDVVADQFGAPTWSRHLAVATALLLARAETPQGLYHLAAADETSWHEYAQTLCAEAQKLDLLARMPEIRRITSADFLRPAPRPANSRLECTRLLHATGIALPDWRVGLVDCLADIADSAP
ncbi:MAG: dTDP-4-dehydrorhamnose reductase [Burkholderiales bacterium]|nr:dTDP-4-dehydrorhamnose reductase [Burkholderiales bacterium]